jgi:hypothetical protein
MKTPLPPQIEGHASTGALVAAERTRNEEMHGRMRRAAVERLDQMERENEIDWPLLKDLSEGRDDIAAQALQREVADASAWWRSQLRAQGHTPETVERLTKAYTDAFWTELRDRVCGFNAPGGGSKISA